MAGKDEVQQESILLKKKGVNLFQGDSLSAAS